MSFDAKKFAGGLHDYLSRAFAPVNRRLDDLEARLVALESHAKDFTYLGVWEPGRTYKRHNVTTRDGGMWIVRAEHTQQRPGDGPDWTLCVKRGRDGKDAAA